MKLTPEQYAALRTSLATLGVEIPVDPTDPRITEAKLEEYTSLLEAKFQEKRSTNDIATLRTIRDGQAALKGEIADRIEIAAELAKLDAEGAPAVVEAKPEPVVEAKVTTEAHKDDTPVIGVGVAAIETTPEVVEAGKVELAKVASAQAAAAKEGTPTGTPLKGTWRTAAAAFGDGAIGAPLASIGLIGGAISDNAAAARNATEQGVRFGDAESKVVVASVPPLVNESGVDTDGILMRGHGPDKNTEIIKTFLADHGARVAAARSGGAHTAAAPWCEPFDIIRAIPDCVDKSTPFRDSLPFIPMGHGGFQFNTGISLAGVAGAVDIWTPADQAAINPADPDTWKRCIPIVCPGDPPTITLDDWITACLEWQVGTDLNNPERVRDYFSKLEALRARVTEQYLMSLVDLLTINYGNTSTAFRVFGGLNDLIRMVLSAFATSSYDERSMTQDGYTMYLDHAQLDTLVAGEVLSSSAKTAGTRASIISYLLEKLPMIQRVVVVRDRVPGSYGTTGANGNPRAANPAANGAVVDVPAFVTAGRIRVIPTSEVFAFGTGELRTGIRQDFSYARQNKVGWFAEEALALTKYGCQPWFAFNATLCSLSRYTGEINWNVDGVTDPFSCAYVTDNPAANTADPFPGS